MWRDLFEAAGAATLLLTAFFALRARSADHSRFSVVVGVGTVYLAVDEAADLHERLGRWMHDDLGWREPPGVNHFDDLITVGVAVAGMVAIAAFRDEVLRHMTFARLFGCGLLLFAAAVVIDARLDPSLARSWWTEEGLELAGAICMALAFRWRLGFLRVRGRGATDPPGLSPQVPGADS